MNWKRGFGIGLLFIGAFITLINGVITGAVIGYGPENYLGLLGILIFIVGGVLIVISGSGLERNIGREIEVYDKGHRNLEEDRRYFMKDPAGFFSTQDLSLRDFRDMYDVVKRDPELLSMARKVYGERLLEISRSNSRNAKVSEKFLEILYEGKIPRKGLEGLSKEEKERIKNAFRVGWHLDFNGAQKEILKTHGLAYTLRSGGHLEIYSLKNREANLITSSTPSDYRTGLITASYIIKVIEQSRKKILSG